MSQEMRGPLAVDHLHRVAQAAVAVHQFARRRALGAMRAAIDRAIPAGLLADPHAVRDFGHHGAADRAVRADVLADAWRPAPAVEPAASALRTLAERQRAERGQAAGREAGAAQESAAIEAAAD